MQTPVDDRFRTEASRYRLRSSCESCVYFEPDARICSEGYPNDEHLSSDLERVQLVVFCKKFELF